MRRLVPLILIAFALAFAGARAVAGPATGPEPEIGGLHRCSSAAITDIHLPGPVPVDEIRVVVAETAGPTAAARVTVDSGAFDRVVRVNGGLSHGLKFTPALTSAVFRVSLDPTFESAPSPCIERIELRRAGAAVATVVP
jgi:hypothetical protein